MSYNQRQTKKPVPPHRVAVLRPFAQWLNGIGAPVEREFQRVGLPFAALEDMNNYVPSECFLAFVVNMAHRDGAQASQMPEQGRATISSAENNQ